MVQIRNRQGRTTQLSQTTLIATEKIAFSSLELSMIRKQGALPERTETYKAFAETFEQKKRTLSFRYAIDKQQSHMEITSTGVTYYIYGSKLSKAAISGDAFSLLSILLGNGGELAYAKYAN